MNAINVLDGFCRTGLSDYRKAIAQIIADIEEAHKLDHLQLAESIDASLGTIKNAYYGTNDMSAVFLMRLGKVYGAAFLNPYFALFGAQAQPIDAPGKDVLPLLTKAAHELACARDPDSVGGTTVLPQEKAKMLPVFKAAHRELSGQIAHIEAVLA